MAKSHQMSLANAMRLLKLTRAQTISALKSDRYCYEGTQWSKKNELFLDT